MQATNIVRSVLDVYFPWTFLCFSSIIFLTFKLQSEATNAGVRTTPNSSLGSLVRAGESSVFLRSPAYLCE